MRAGEPGERNVRTTKQSLQRCLTMSGIVAGATVIALLSSGAAVVGASAPPPGPGFQGLSLDFTAPLPATKPEAGLLDSRLSRLDEIARNEGPVAARNFASANAIALDEQGRVNVLIHQIARPDYEGSFFDPDDPEQRIGRMNFGEEALFDALEVPIRQEVERVDGTIRGRVSNLVDASIPIGGLRSFSSGAVGWIEPAPVPHTTVVSEGVNVIQANALQASQATYLPGDEPVKVGVLDLGFKGYQSLLGSELPATVTVNSFHPGGIDGVGEALLDQIHGTACAEIVFDVAPEAELYLVNFDSVSDNDAAVDWLISQDVDVISYSIGWFNAGPGDGRGPINAAVDRALNAGVEWVTSVGNAARDHWQGPYTDPDGDGIHNFAPDDESNAIFLNAGDGLTVFLNWDDWFASDQDYDLYIVDGDGEVVAASENFQTGTQNPAETAGFVASAAGTYHVVIVRFDSNRDVNLEMFFQIDVAREMQYVVPAGSVTIPADTDGAIAVGATFWADDMIEVFSSQGPTADGRMKPDLTAPDGVSTVSYGNEGLQFFGTSASAPHTAGAIALMKARFGVFSLDQVREILYGRAMDRGDAGFDNVYGRGRLDVRGQ